MRILDWIEKTREKPEGQRKITAFFLTLGCMAIVIFLWLFVELIPGRFADENSDNVRALSEKGPISVVGDMIGETVVRIKELNIFDE
ncbi:MAG: hypothetical protein PHC85_01575 [Candidatus Pacebacteria bacterium]|nr:hypothetical protein [Candidatus Paceibacterota bacterium]